MKTHARRLLTTLASLALLLSCAFAAVGAWRAGASRRLAEYARAYLVSDTARRAARMSPEDPETHSALGLVLYNVEDRRGALAEFERAAALRPRHFDLWVQLGRAREEAGDAEGAVAALREAMRLAPFYSEPRWQYGNVLYRRGRLDEAFAEMRRAAESNPTLYPALADLAWGTYRGDAREVERVASPRKGAERLALARLFARKGRPDLALAHFRAAGEVDAYERRSFLKELLRARQFAAAYEVWAGGREGVRGGAGVFTEPGFEGRVNTSELGFGWRQEREFEGVSLSLDAQSPNSGARSLLVEWGGHASPGVSVISQLVLVEPGARYRLVFHARTESVKTGGPPVVVVADASAEDARVLAESKTLPQGTAAWQEYAAEFTPTPETEAVLVSLRRQNCDASPCPMFGRVWLDDFSLRKL
ncbi:MAG TPA: tetratricopeptide repeat protein [Pyrinomonadaceae bacterium]|nr:tetratricopeptide repeat protein [Pyrinomonadaceae bacterium]